MVRFLFYGEYFVWKYLHRTSARYTILYRGAGINVAVPVTEHIAVSFGRCFRDSQENKFMSGWMIYDGLNARKSGRKSGFFRLHSIKANTIWPIPRFVWVLFYFKIL